MRFPSSLICINAKMTMPRETRNLITAPKLPPTHQPRKPFMQKNQFTILNPINSAESYFTREYMCEVHCSENPQISSSRPLGASIRKQ